MMITSLKVLGHILVALPAATSFNNPVTEPSSCTRKSRIFNPLLNSSWSNNITPVINTYMEMSSSNEIDDPAEQKQQQKTPPQEVEELVIENAKIDTNGEEDKDKNKITGKIIRCAARPHLKEASKPSSPEYTTRKNSLPLIHITPAGVTGDYNHYRTKALSSTADRAVSILTTDVMQGLRSDGKEYAAIRDGDLGENILVEGLTFQSFNIGERYMLGNKLLVEITERIEPCGNLCKLKFINRNDLKPKERVKRCMDFLTTLDKPDGARGWYAKVIGDGGVVHVGDEVIRAA